MFWLRKISRKWNFSYRKILQYITLWIVTCIAVFLCYFIFFSSYFRIDTIYFDDNNVEQLSNHEVYTFIQSWFVQKNYFRSRFFATHDVLKSIREKYPFVQDITISQKTHNSYYISCVFNPPRIIYALWKDSYIGSYDEEFYVLYSGDNFLSGQQLLLLPTYITNLNQVSGIYSRFSEEKLLKVLNLIQQVIPQDTIKSYTFVPWNSLLLLWMKSGQELLLSLVKDINPQLVKRLDVQQYYSDYKQFHSLDLWSTEHIIAR